MSDPVPGSGIATYNWTKVSGPGNVSFGTPGAEDTNVDADTDGTYVCRLNVTDTAGNYAYDEFTLVWDTTPPDVNAGSDATINATYLQDATVSDPDPSSGIASYLWTKVSGTGDVNFGTPGAEDTNVDADADGTYVCRLTVTDSAGNSAYDEFTLVWDTTPPDVNAGSDATINATYLQDATVSDPNPSSGIASYLWTQESGLGTVTFGTPSTVDTNVDADTDGTYVCRLTVTDSAGNSAFDEFTLVWDTTPPNVEAGTNSIVNAIYLQDATVSDPDPSSGITSYLWTKVSGPGTVIFGTPSTEDTMAGADMDGTYVCRLTVTDSAGNSAYDEFTLVWDTIQPDVNAGADAIINATYLQDATVSDPSPSSGIAMYLWTKVSGTGNVNFGTPGAEDTNVDADTDGTYVCRLTVTDEAGNSAFDEFTLLWDTTPPNVAAGPNAIINATNLQDATASDPAPSSEIATYLWTQESGLGTVTFGTPGGEDTTLSADTDGTYVCRLTVTDYAGNSAFDELTLVWDTTPPNVNAGPNATVNASYLQDATVSDPSPSSGIATYLWTKVSGPGSVTFGTPDTEDTTLGAETDGTYVCRLTVTDNAGNSASDELTFVWDSTPPSVDAGADAIFSGVNLQNATATDLGSGIATYLWTKVSGPGTVTFGTPDTEDTTLSANTEGTYVCRLTVTDYAGNSAFDELILVWDTESPELNHTEVTEGAINEPVIISVEVVDALGGVDTVELFYKRASDGTYTSLPMIPSGNMYNIQITPDTAGIWEYYIKATDKSTEPNIAYYGLFGEVLVEPNSASDIDIGVIGADITPPQVSTTSPSGTNVPITTTIIMIFNEAMDQLSVENAFSMGGVTGNFSWTGNTLTFKPESPLTGLTQYTVQLDTSAKDIAGNSLSSVFSFQFTTEADPSKPAITDYSPKGSDVVVNKDITVVFSKQMDTASVESAFSISPPVGTGDFRWDGNELTFDPDALFKTNTQYAVTISSGAKDTEGNSLVEFYWDFTTETDASVQLPKIISYGPTGNEVLIDTMITVGFDVQMDEEATENAIAIMSESGAEVEGNWDWDLDTKTGFYTGTFDPIHELEYNTQYNVSISTEAMSLDGEYLQGEKTWLFKTVEKEKVDEPGLLSWDTLEPMITGLTILASILLALFGFLKLKKKRGRLAEYLEQIEETYDEYKHDYDTCYRELISLRDKIKIEVKQGNLEEGHFLILDKKIDDYIRDLRIAKREGRIVPEKQPSLDAFEEKPEEKSLDLVTEESAEIKEEPEDKDSLDDWLDDEDWD
ncbi:MAG: Ig-like domain-containing protein [Fidelibacterota bacterium]|nr:MAG: Ig-like domain-containing protein [Candidatus Neomarinimicrobiota bacterium]